MRYLAPYQTGIWLAEYFNIRCQLCTVYRSMPQSQLSQSHSLLRPSLSSQHSFFANTIEQCHQRFSSGFLCDRCHHSIVWLPKPFAVDIAAGMTLNIQAATYYDYPMRQAIKAFKHDEDMTKLPLLLHVIRQIPRPHGCHHDNSIIVAMPTTNQRLIKRGFDPVSILATHLSKHWLIPLWQGVKRIDDTISQQGLTRAERLTNLNNAFALIEPPPVKRLILFDDVATTGASLQALARTIISKPVSTSIISSTNSTQSYNNYDLFAYVLAHGNNL